MLSFDSQDPDLKDASNKKKTLRTSALAISVALHVLILAALWLNPIKFTDLSKEVLTDSGVKAELASSDYGSAVTTNPVKDKSQSASQSSKSQIAKSLQKANPKPASKVVSKNTLVKTTNLTINNMVVPVSSDAISDVTDMVREIMGSANHTEPMDFQMVDGALVAQVSHSALGALESQLSAKSAGGGGDCQAMQGLQAALQSDELFKQALLQIPRNERSVANVVMAWDGQWTGVIGDAPDVSNPDETVPFPELLKARIQEHVRTSTFKCLNETIYGPSFILINATDVHEMRDETVILAIGSGEWRWADLIAPDALPVDSLKEIYLRLPKLKLGEQ